MKLQFIIDKLESVPENVRELYVESDGKFKLDVDGAIPKSELDAATKELDSLRSIAKGPDGKTFKEAFEGSQTANKAIRGERDALDAQLKKWQELGDLDAVRQWKDELDGLKATGAKLTDAQQQIAELKKTNREYLDQVNTFKSKTLEYESANKELGEYKTRMEKQLDMANAEAQIAAVVESLPIANQKALRRNLIDRYKAGDLKRDEAGNLVDVDEERNLATYAKDTMEAFGLFNPSTSGISNPLSSASRTTAAKETTFQTMAGLFKDA